MKHVHSIDKSGEDPTECDYCGFHSGGHIVDCPAAKLPNLRNYCGECITPISCGDADKCKIPQNAPLMAGDARMSDTDHKRNALTLAYLKATERRFSGEALTGFGAL